MCACCFCLLGFLLLAVAPALLLLVLDLLLPSAQHFALQALLQPQLVLGVAGMLGIRWIGGGECYVVRLLLCGNSLGRRLFVRGSTVHVRQGTQHCIDGFQKVIVVVASGFGMIEKVLISLLLHLHQLHARHRVEWILLWIRVVV